MHVHSSISVVGVKGFGGRVGRDEKQKHQQLKIMKYENKTKYNNAKEGNTRFEWIQRVTFGEIRDIYDS